MTATEMHDAYLAAPSIEERIRRITHALRLIEAATHGMTDSGVDTPDLVESIGETLRELLQEDLFALRALPGLITNLHAPAVPCDTAADQFALVCVIEADLGIGAAAKGGA